MEMTNWMTVLACKPEEYPKIHHSIETINHRNYKLFGLTEEKVHKYATEKFPTIVQERRKAYFKDGWYCTYTDNIDHKDKFVNKNVIITVHGNPGDEVEWRRLETSYNNRGRFINFIVPGYDGESEIRGTFKSNWGENCKMVFQLIEYLKIPKVIFCGHSMGGLLMYNFGLLYPERCQAFIYMAAPPNKMYIGLTCFDGLIRVHYQEMVGKDISKLNDPEFRKKVTSSFNEVTKEVYFKSGEKEKPSKFPVLRESEVCAWMKMIDDKMPWEHLEKVKDQPRILKLLLFTTNDPIVDHESYFVTSYDIIKNASISYEECGISKEWLSKLLECDREELSDNLQEVFLLKFRKGGHQVHVRHGKILAEIVDKFVKVVDCRPVERISPKLGIATHNHQFNDMRPEKPLQIIEFEKRKPQMDTITLEDYERMVSPLKSRDILTENNKSQLQVNLGILFMIQYNPESTHCLTSADLDPSNFVE